MPEFPELDNNLNPDNWSLDRFQQLSHFHQHKKRRLEIMLSSAESGQCQQGLHT